MAHRAPRRAHRKGLTFLQVADMFGDEAKAEAWVAERPGDRAPWVFCISCGIGSELHD